MAIGLEVRTAGSICAPDEGVHAIEKESRATGKKYRDCNEGRVNPDQPG
jgi:hypothetical protein